MDFEVKRLEKGSSCMEGIGGHNLIEIQYPE